MPFKHRSGILMYGPSPTYDQWATLLSNWLDMWPPTLQAKLPWGPTPSSPGGLSGWEVEQLLDDLARTHRMALVWCGRNWATDKLWLQIRDLGAGEDLSPCPACDMPAQALQQALEQAFQGNDPDQPVVFYHLCGGAHAVQLPACGKVGSHRKGHALRL